VVVIDFALIYLIVDLQILLFQVAEAAQETNLVHKALKKVSICFFSSPSTSFNLLVVNHSIGCYMVLQDLDKNSLHTRMKITIPQEPDFATSHRANRIRLGPRHWMIVNCYGKNHTSYQMIISGTRTMLSWSRTQHQYIDSKHDPWTEKLVSAKYLTWKPFLYCPPPQTCVCFL